MFVWFGVIPVAVFLVFRVVVITNVKFRDIVMINGFMLPWGLFSNVRLAVVAGMIIIWVSGKRVCWKGLWFQLVGVTQMCVGGWGDVGGGNKLVIVFGHAGGQKIMMLNIGIVARTRRLATAAVIVIVIMTR